MSYKDLEHQQKLIDTHIAKANQCLEYHKLDDANVHLTIARILLEGHIQAKPSNTAQAAA